MATGATATKQREMMARCEGVVVRYMVGELGE